MQTWEHLLKARGMLPANMERLVTEMVKVTTPWYEILERFMMGKINDSYSWKRPNRRFIGRDIYLPGSDSSPSMGHVIIGVDTSCSVGQEELNIFAGHINRILETCFPALVSVVYCDTQVNHVDEYTADDLPINLVAHGGGGTAFKPVFDWADNYAGHEEIECVIYLTDGYGDQNSFNSTWEAIWLTTGTTEFDWGTVIEFKE